MRKNQLLGILVIPLVLSACGSRAQGREAVEAIESPIASSGTHIELALAPSHQIQADVRGKVPAQASAVIAEVLPVSVEDLPAVFAPKDTSALTEEEASEGRKLVSENGNRFYTGHYRLYFDKAEEALRQKYDEIAYLLRYLAENDPSECQQELDFISSGEAMETAQELLEGMGCNLEPVLQAYAALPADEVVAAQKKLLQEETEYFDPFGKVHPLADLGEEDDACYLEISFAYQGIPVFNGSPQVSYIDGVLPPYPVTASLLITRQGLQYFEATGLFRAGQSAQSGDILSPEEAVEAYRQKYDLVIHPEEDAIRVSEIYLEYIPIEEDTGKTLVPYWCFPMETEAPVGWVVSNAERFNAFTGKDMTYGG